MDESSDSKAEATNHHYFKDYMEKFKKLFDRSTLFQFGFISILVAILFLNIITLILNYFPLIIVYINNLIRLVMTIFSIFSFYTWLNLIYGNKCKLNDKKIFIIFLICFLSEFLIQFLTFECDKVLNKTNNLLTNLQNVIVITLICTLISYYLNYDLNHENIIYIGLICSTRFYGSVYLSEILPNTICSYFTYLCALGGVLFSHFINSISMINENLNLCNISISFTNQFDKKSRLSQNGCLKRSLFDLNEKKFLLGKINNSDSSNFENNISDTSINENLLKSNRNRRKLSNSSLLNKRRTSLPTSIPLKSEKESSKYSQSLLINEVERIIDDVLRKDEQLTEEIYTKSFEKIKSLISRSNLFFKLTDQKKQALEYNKSSNKQSNSKNQNAKLITNYKYYNELPINKYDYYVNMTESNSFSADEDDENKFNQSTEVKQFKNKSRRSLPVPCPRRSSGFTCSTTTSATGLPIDFPPSRQRSLSLKCCANNCEKFLTNNFTKSEEITREHYQAQSVNFIKNKIDDSSYENKRIFDEDEDNITSSVINNSCQNKTSDYESGESPTNSDYNSDTDKLNLKVITSFGSMIENSVNSYKFLKDSSDIISYHHVICNKKLDQIKEEYNQSSNNMNNNLNNVKRDSSIDDNLLWQAEDLKDLELLNYLHDWSFPIFQFYEKSNHNVISQMAYKIFDEVGLFKSFDIPITPFIQYFTALERGYIDLPYHNKVHAADVLHACYYLTTQAVPGLIQINDSVKVCNERIPLNPYQYSLKFSLTNNETYGCTGANFTPLELLALYCSAAMHDYEHPGRNNQFLVSINSPLALLYNDRSVLENHHASSSWLLLKSDPKFNFLTGLDSAEWKKFRFLILENILATDLSKHFSIIAEFNQKANIDPKRIGILHKSTIPYDFDNGIDWTSESDRLLCSKMILKLADINAPLKDRDLHVQWTHRIVQEFYLQGDEELSLGMAISPFMDRRKPQIAKLQENFIHNLVASLCTPFTHAGLLPGFLIEDTESTDESDGDCSSSIRTITKHKPKIFYSELLSNIKLNYEMWREIVKQEQLAISK